jgi:hypothetical protein
MVRERRGFDSVGWFDMMIRVLLVYELDRAAQIFKARPSVRHEILCETSLFYDIS